jgi:Ras-related protein Rab-2A
MVQPIKLKFVTLGESAVGKTSLLRRLCENAFTQTGIPTLGVEYFPHSVIIDGQPVCILLWDTAGQERFFSVSLSYIRSALGIILVFDITLRSSFDAIPKWLREVRSKADPNCSVILIGNKSDLAENRRVSQSEAEDFAKAHSLSYIEASAANGENVEEAFLKVARELNGKVNTGVIQLEDSKTK